MQIPNSLRSFKLDDLLLKFSSILKMMFQDKKPFIEIPLSIKRGMFSIQGNILLTPWEINSLASIAITETNDFAKNLASLQDFKELLNAYKKGDEDFSRSFFENGESSDEEIFFKALLGLSQHQFWYQEIGSILAQFNRQVEMLEVLAISKGIFEDINFSCREITGLSIRELRICSIMVFFLALNYNDLSKCNYDSSIVLKLPFLTKTNIDRVISTYTEKYYYFRNSGIGHLALLVKPIVETTKGMKIPVNIYAIAKKISEGPFWAIRDYYKTKNSNEFTKEYGQLFELYVEKLFYTYLPKNIYTKIERSNLKKRADWFIYVGKFRLIIEQKSTIAAINIKQQYPDSTYLENWIGGLAEGVKQLCKTEEDFPSKKVTIKCLLLLDYIPLADGIVRPLVVKRLAGIFHNLENIYFMNIDAIEKLSFLINSNQVEAEKIIQKKIDQDSLPVSEGREFEQLMASIKNDYIDNKINWYDKYFR